MIQHEWSTQDFRLVTYHAYEEGIPFTRESWRGRIRASRAIGATLRAEEVEPTFRIGLLIFMNI